MQEVQTRTQLQTVRKARGLAAAELAQRVGISRQTIYAIEDGSYVPNTTVALRLARVLDMRVEELFILDEPDENADNPLPADLLTSTSEETGEGQLVRLCRVGERLLAVPCDSTSAYLPPAEGILQRRAGSNIWVKPFATVPSDHKRLLLAGCDPALSVLTELMALSGVEVISVPCCSHTALQWLKQGRVHIAGSHLRDRTTGNYNVPFVQRTFPAGSMRVVTFAVWEEGLVVRRGNPKNITAITDLVRKDVQIMNREKGSGSRDLLDKGLRTAGIEAGSISGYSDLAAGHLAAAQAIAKSSADCCIATQSAARRFGLDFIPLATERFDLTLSQDSLGIPGVKALLETLNHAALRQKLQGLAGYETQSTGKVQL